MGDESYNGYVNRETWAVALHLTNDEGLLGWARESYDCASYAGEAESQLEDFVGEILDPGYWASEFGEIMPEWARLMAADAGSLWRVDWSEVLESVLGDETPPWADDEEGNGL